MRSGTCVLRIYRELDGYLRAYHLEASRDGRFWVRLSSHWTLAGLYRVINHGG